MPTTALLGRTPSLLLYALLALVGAVSATAATAPPLADDAFDEPFTLTPTQLLAAADATSAAADDEVVYLYQAMHRRWDDDGRVVATLHQIYQVRSKAALDGWGLTESRWSPWYQARPEVQARVIGPDGSEHWLDPERLTESGVAGGDPTMFDDDRVLRGPLPGMAVGAVIEEHVVERDEQPYFPGGGSTRLPLGEFVPVDRLRVVLEAPTRASLRWRALGREPEVRKSRGGGMQRVVLALDDVPALTSLEEYVPSDRSSYPFVEVSTARSWNDVASRYHTLIAPAMTGDQLGPLVDEVRAGADREARIEIAHAIARDRIRYTGAELGQQSIVPYPIDETLGRAYGDCKDKAALLVALLDAVGIEAHVALLRAGPGPDVFPELPGLQLFSHAVVHVPGEPERWLDPTADFLAAGELPLSDQGRWALVAAPSTRALSRIPTAPAAATTYREQRRIELPVEGTARVIEGTTATGWIADSLRRNYADTDTGTLATFLAGYAAKAYVDGTLIDWRVADVHDVRQPFSIDLDVANARIGYASGADAVVMVDPTVILGWLPDGMLAADDITATPLATRDHPVALPPHRAEVSYQIAVADGYAIRELPPSRTRAFGGASLEETWAEGEDGVLEVRFAVETGTEPLAPLAAQQLRNALLQLQRGAPYALTFDQIGEVHLAHGRIREAIDAYADLVARHPDVGLYRSLMGAAMLPAGLGDAARAEAHRAVELDPASAACWRYLGYVLMHDRFGRELAAPFDRDGAIEALERAILLEPMDAVGIQNLAVVLEHDHDGLRYATGADLARAEQLYRERRASFDTRDLDLNLLFVLYHLDDHVALQSLAAEMPSSGARDALRFASIAVSDGAAAALADATREALTGVPKHAELQEAARLLIQRRHYAEAAALLRGAAAGAANPVALRQRAELLDRLRPYPELIAEADGPELAVLRLLELLFHGESSPGELADAMSARLLEDEDPGEALDEVLSQMRADMRNQGIGGEVVLDMALSALEFDVSGDDRVGYQVLGRGPDATTLAGCYVVREGGAYKVLSTGESLPVMGREALRRATRGDLEGARRWLRWIHEEAPGGGAAGPFDAEPYQRIYGDGERLDRARVRHVAAALMAPAYSEEAVTELERGLEGDLDDGDRVQLQRALLVAYRGVGRHDESLRVSRALVAEFPDEPWPRLEEVRSLLELERTEEARDTALAAGQRFPDHPRIAGAAMATTRLLGDIEATVIHARAAVAAAPTDPDWLNDLAWYLLFTDGGVEEALGLAVRANTARAEMDTTALHTLAVAQVEAGRVDEAREVMVLALGQLSSADHLSPVWWYVVGRIAEAYGLPGAAIDAYRRVPADDRPMSTRVLTERRLSALDALD